jgi:PAS domain S-box-containing protein
MAAQTYLHDARSALAAAWHGVRAEVSRALVRLPSPYLLGAVVALAALGVTRLTLDLLAGAHFLVLLGAVCLAAVYGGARAGLAAVALSGAGYLLVVAGDAWTSLAGTSAVHHATRLGLFVVVGVVESFAVGSVRLGAPWRRHAGVQAQRRSERHRRVRFRIHEEFELLRMMANHLAEGLVALDQHGRVAFMNASARRILGWAERELAGKPFDEMVHARSGDGAPCTPESFPLTSVLSRGQAVQGQDLVFRRKDGSDFPVAYTSSPIPRRGRVVGAVLTFQDFSEHVRMEHGERFIARATHALTESIDWEATLRRVAQLAVPFLGDWCLVALDDERGLRAVAAAHADAGKARAIDDLLERYPLVRDAEHGIGKIMTTSAPELVPEVDVDAFVAERGEGARIRADILRELGLRSYLGVPLVARGKTLGAIAFAFATTPRRYGPGELAIAEELARRCALAIDNARLYREAQEATRTREELLAIVSHDLRAPIGAVQIAAGLLARRMDEGGWPELKRTADTLKRATARAARLVDDLVDWARLERGRFRLERAAHDATAIARDALALAEPAARQQGVTLDLQACPQAGAADCDRHRVLQVLANFIDNALKVMPVGGALRLAVRRQGSEVVFAVSDTGPGIAEQDLQHVFDRYYRGSGAKYEGSGLGLAIARGIVEAHGGRITASSAPGEGATFTFTLPAAALVAPAGE